MRPRLLSSSSIDGTEVKNKSGEKLGHIKDLMINMNDGSISYAVLSFGGFMGFGDKYFAIPWTSFSIDMVDEKFILNVEKERLENAPGFDKNNWPSSLNSDYYQIVDTHYGMLEAQLQP
jgi:sporulation protein YlmC with PRC-barrel domain